MSNQPIVHEERNIYKYKLGHHKRSKTCKVVQLLEEPCSSLAPKCILNFDKSVNYSLQVSNVIIVQDKRNGLVEYCIYEISSKEMWDPCIVMKFKEPESEFLKKLRETLKIYSFPVICNTNNVSKEYFRFHITDRFFYFMQECPQERRLKNCYHFTYNEEGNKVYIDILKIDQEKARMCIKVISANDVEKSARFETDHCRAIVAILKRFARDKIRSIDDSSNVLSLEESRYASPRNTHPPIPPRPETSPPPKTPEENDDVIGNEQSKATEKRKKKEGDVYVYHMVPEEFNNEKDKDIQCENGKVFQTKTTSHHQKSRYADTNLLNGNNRYIDFNKALYKETLEDNLEKDEKEINIMIAVFGPEPELNETWCIGIVILNLNDQETYEKVKNLEIERDRKLVSYNQVIVKSDIRLNLKINDDSLRKGFDFEEDDKDKEFKISYSTIRDLNSTRWMLFELSVEYNGNDIMNEQQYKSNLLIEALRNRVFVEISKLKVYKKFKPSNQNINQQIMQPTPLVRFTLSPIHRLNLCRELDLPHPTGKDWRHFACIAGFNQSDISTIENNRNYDVKTEGVLQLIERQQPQNCNDTYLKDLLREMDRRDLLNDFFKIYEP